MPTSVSSTISTCTKSVCSKRIPKQKPIASCNYRRRIFTLSYRHRVKHATTILPSFQHFWNIACSFETFTGGRKKNIPFRRQRMELDCPPPPAEPVVPILPYTKDPYVADLLRVADENMAKVKEESCALREERDGLQVKLDSFRKQVRVAALVHMVFCTPPLWSTCEALDEILYWNWNYMFIGN